LFLFCLIGTEWLKEKKEEQFFALCIAFDKIEKITVGEIQVCLYY
jgi:hypothetical protein